MVHLNTRNIVIPTDFSETSLLAIKHGAFLAQYTKGDVYLVHVIAKHWEKFNPFASLINQDSIDKATGIVEAKLEEMAEEIRKSYGVTVKTFVSTGSPTAELVKFTKEIDAGMVVMGTHGYTAWEDVTVGSNTLKVISKNDCPVMTMSQKADGLGYHDIVLPIDTSEHSRHKVGFTLELAKLFSAKLHVVATLTPDEASKVPFVNVVLHQIKQMAEAKGLVCDTKMLDNLKNRAVATVDYTNEVGGDLIVIVNDQDSELSGLFLGSYALQVIHHSKVPVISVKPEAHPENVTSSILAGT